MSAGAPLSSGTEPGTAIEKQMDAWVGFGPGCAARDRATVGAAAKGERWRAAERKPLVAVG